MWDLGQVTKTHSPQLTWEPEQQETADPLQIPRESGPTVSKDQKYSGFTLSYCLLKWGTNVVRCRIMYLK